MKVPSIKLSDISKKAVKNILKESKTNTNICEQMQMANYYAFLNSKQNINKDKLEYAKLLLGK